jgi:membrane fusion protein (multidrug efflux system)
MIYSKVWQLALIAVVLSLSSCSKTTKEDATQNVYSTKTVMPSSVVLSDSYTASIRGQQDVDIFPQVTGRISKLYVNEGQKVRKGQPLFVIDQVPYKAALLTAVANVHAAQAKVKTARLDYNSKLILYRKKIISEYELFTADNTLAAALANLEQTQADKMNAANNLSYTVVTSPSDGVVGTIPYRIGTLASSSMQQPLTTISDNARIFVYFSMTESRIRNLIHTYGTIEDAIKSMPMISLRLNDGTVYGERGRIATISGVINSTTGTASVRAVFPNEQRLLLSGGICDVIIQRTDSNALVIPQTSTYELQDKVFVYKLKGDKVQTTEVNVEDLGDGNHYIVRSGLRRGDRIVIEGINMLHDGMRIHTKGN